MAELSDIAKIISETVANASSERFSEAGMNLVKARDAIREELQGKTVAAMTPIIQKLTKNQPLSPEEKDLVRLWMVGDAAGFTKKEADYRDWLEEFGRLGENLRNVGQMPTSFSEMLDLHGSLEEAVRLAGNIQFFLEEKERVARFERAIQNLSASEAEMLAGILKEKLRSPDM